MGIQEGKTFLIFVEEGHAHKGSVDMKNIFFTDSLIEDQHFIKWIERDSNRFALICDENVAKLYSGPLLEFIRSKNLDCTLITFPSGDHHKTRHQKEAIEDALIEKKFGRDTTLIVMGGGVAHDLGGFVAATYLRGVPYLFISTTLLAMVDASIGGKTGVNLKEGKNLIGTIYFPKAIFIDFSTLKTLPDHEMLNGCAEIIKYGLISDPTLIDRCTENFSNLKDLKFLERMVKKCVHLKMKIVSHDPYEAGERRVLNFGHTIGHAIERIEGYKIAHGEAIAIGMIVEGFIAFKMGFLREKEFDKIYQIFKFMGFPLALSKDVTQPKMVEAMQTDKKGHGGSVRMVILRGIGDVAPFKNKYCSNIESAILAEALAWMISEFVT